MKQALLITAYKDFDQLENLCARFNGKFNLYIHIDKKTIFTKSCRERLSVLANVRYIGQDYVINWGGVNHLKSYLKLLELALKDEENGFFHLITGQDYPIQTFAQFENIAEDAVVNNKNYLNVFNLPSAYWEHGGIDRVERYNFYDLIDAKKYHKWIKRIHKIQLILGVKRSLKDLPEKLFGGSTYWSLNRACVRYVMDYTRDNVNFLHRFKYTFCAEEIYFQTIIMNSKFASTVINDNLRYIDWKSGRGGYPAFLDESDYDLLVNSGKLFARKIDKRSGKLVDKLKNRIDSV